MTVEKSQSLALRVAARSGLILASAASSSFGSPVCVRCDGPEAAVLCVVDDSAKVEALPFGHVLVERACVKLLKSEGRRHCKVASDEACKGATPKHVSLKDAKHALLGQARSEPPQPAPIPAAAATIPPASKGVQTSSNPVVNAWMHIKSIFGGLRVSPRARRENCRSERLFPISRRDDHRWRFRNLPFGHSRL